MRQMGAWGLGPPAGKVWGLKQVGWEAGMQWDAKVGGALSTGPGCALKLYSRLNT